MQFRNTIAVFAAMAFASAAAFAAGGQMGMDRSEGYQQQQHAAVQQPDISRDAVRQVQQQLKDEGLYQEGQIDGLWGPKTQDAVAQYQQQQGIESSGQLNAETLEAMGLLDRSEFAKFQEQGEQQEQPGSRPESAIPPDAGPYPGGPERESGAGQE